MKPFLLSQEDPGSRFFVCVLFYIERGQEGTEQHLISPICECNPDRQVRKKPPMIIRSQRDSVELREHTRTTLATSL